VTINTAPISNLSFKNDSAAQDTKTEITESKIDTKNNKLILLNDASSGTQRIVYAPNKDADEFVKAKKANNITKAKIVGIGTLATAAAAAIIGIVTKKSGLLTTLYGIAGMLIGFTGAALYRSFRKDKLSQGFIAKYGDNEIPTKITYLTEVKNVETVLTGLTTIHPQESGGNRTVGITAYEGSIPQQKHYDLNKTQFAELMNAKKQDVTQSKIVLAVPLATTLAGAAIGSAIKRTFKPSGIGAIIGLGFGLAAAGTFIIKKGATNIRQFIQTDEIKAARIQETEKGNELAAQSKN